MQGGNREIYIGKHLVMKYRSHSTDERTAPCHSVLVPQRVSIRWFHKQIITKCGTGTTTSQRRGKAQRERNGPLIGRQL